MSDLEERLDRLEAHLDARRQRLAEHESALDEAGTDDLPDSQPSGGDPSDGTAARSGSGLAAGGLLAAAGLAVGTVSGTTSPTPTPAGEVGTYGRSVAAVYATTLAGPVTDGQRVDSLVGDDLAIEDGTLTLGGN